MAASVPNFSDYRTVGEAASFLGVSTATLRNWDRTGKLRPRRHPQNGYRIYLHEDLEALLRSADISNLGDSAPLPLSDWSDIGETEHFVQFYESDGFLVDAVGGFLAPALYAGDCALVIGTAEHRKAICEKLASDGINLAQVAAEGRYVELDAGETLLKLMTDVMHDRERFMEIVGAQVEQLTKSGKKLRAFGEMVALLWSDGKRQAAIQLEGLWNELGQKSQFALLCAYPMSEFSRAADATPLNEICTCHTRVLPSEAYSQIIDLDERLRAVTLLQQKAQSLEAEVAHRGEVERFLAERERELADFFESAVEGLHKVGPDGTILWANKAECSMLGYELDEYVGHSIKEFHADADVIDSILAKLTAGESLHNCPARLRSKDGSIKHVLISSSPCIEEGEFRYTRCFTRDVTELWHAEQAVREADRRKDAFLATLAHELRNPLAPIRNALQIMRLNNDDAAVAQEALDILDRQVRQMTRLVDDLLDVSRISRDKLELRKQRIDVSEVIKTAVETSRPLIDAAGHTLTLTLPTRAVFVEADPIRLAQVFSNLLNNSAKYTERGGKISLQTVVEDHEIVVSVRDNGIGIECEALAYVFDMFRQADRSLDRSQGGLGIGLSLVRRLVELHGGRVNALSEGLGKGSEFVVRLPLAPLLPNRLLPVPTTNGHRAIKRRVLVVDDNRDSAETLSLFLRMKGHEARTALNGVQAVEITQEFLPDVILMDVGMPTMDGYEATRQIRKMPIGTDILIVALTGWGQPEDIQQSSQAGCSAHLVKPVDFALLERLMLDGKVSTN